MHQGPSSGPRLLEEQREGEPLRLHESTDLTEQRPALVDRDKLHLGYHPAGVLQSFGAPAEGLKLVTLHIELQQIYPVKAHLGIDLVECADLHLASDLLV